MYSTTCQQDPASSSDRNENSAKRIQPPDQHRSARIYTAESSDSAAEPTSGGLEGTPQDRRREDETTEREVGQDGAVPHGIGPVEHASPSRSS